MNKVTGINVTNLISYQKYNLYCNPRKSYHKS